MAALFDIDGTLFDSREAFSLMVLELSKELGLPGMEGRDFIQLLGRPDPEIADAIVPKVWPDRENVVNKYVKLANERWSSFYLPNYVKAYPGVRQALEVLRAKGYKVGVVSNGNRHELPLYLRHGEIDDLVEAVVSADDVPMPKPNPDGLLEACRRLGVTPRRTFYAGDTPADVLAAKAAGCFSLAVLCGVGKREDLLRTGPDLILDSISVIPMMIDKIETMLFQR